MTLPDFEDLALTRLQLCFAEVTGIARAFKLPPTQPVEQADIPFSFTLPGPMTGPAQMDGGGRVDVVRLYVARIMVMPLKAASLDNADDGAYAIAQTVNFMSRVRNYLADHPRLSTTTLDDLSYLAQDVTWQDTGPVSRPGPGGTDYAAIDFNLTLAMRAKSTRFS